MSDKTKTNAYGSFPFLGLLALAFIVLRLCKVIMWPWLWVLAPLWIPAAIVVVAAIIIFIVKQ